MRYLTAEQVPEPVDFFSVDVSFISLCLVLPVARQFMADGAQAVCLIKPQFEAGRGQGWEKGVVREPSIHVEVVDKIVQFVLEHGYSVEGLTYSPVKGPRGTSSTWYFYPRQNSRTVSHWTFQRWCRNHTQC